MNDNFLLHWTQYRFLDKIKSEWLKHWNASLFYVWKWNWDWDLVFTITMTVYHAIWIIQQNDLLNRWYKKLSDYYVDNPDFLPVILIFRSKIAWVLQRGIYQNIQNEWILSYPYTKISDTWDLNWNDLLYSTWISIEDVQEAEKWLWEIKQWNKRFFRKYWESSDWLVKDPNLIWYKLLDSEYIYRFCYLIAEKILRSIIWETK